MWNFQSILRTHCAVLPARSNEWMRICHLDFKLSPCFESCIYSFGYFPGVRLWFADVSEPSISSIFKGWMKSMKVLHTLHPALEDGTDRGFRNVGKPQSDGGEIPKRIHTEKKAVSIFRVEKKVHGITSRNMLIAKIYVRRKKKRICFGSDLYRIFR